MSFMMPFFDTFMFIAHVSMIVILTIVFIPLLTTGRFRNRWLIIFVFVFLMYINIRDMLILVLT